MEKLIISRTISLYSLVGNVRMSEWHKVISLNYTTIVTIADEAD